MVIAAAIAGGINYYNKNHSETSRDQTQSESNKFEDSNRFDSSFDSSKVLKTDSKTLQKLNKARENSQSKLGVTVHGKVIKTLKDDLKGSRHQKFLVKIDDNFTLLIAHNIDLAPRVPIEKGISVSVSGRYEWNNRGGVIHWTHHDPRGKKKGGWIRVNGKKYD